MKTIILRPQLILWNLVLVFLFSIIQSCQKKQDQPKVIYDKDSNKENLSSADVAQVTIADLPIQFQGTNYLIFPIGNMNVIERLGKSGFESTSNGANVSYSISNTIEDEITGYLKNLKFQKVDSDSLTVLTDKPILLQSVKFHKSYKKSFLVFSLADTDTNKDGKLDTNDIKTLYVSETSGQQFTKLSPDGQELIDWNCIDSKNRLYFRTIEDINKNGSFDKDDKVHYYYVNLLESVYKSNEYKPF